MTGATPRDRLLTLKRDLDTAIAANRAASGDDQLDALNAKLERWRRFVMLGLEQQSRLIDTAASVGPNWHGPGIYDDIDMCARIRGERMPVVEESFRVERRVAA
jgi:hypothetical protein